MFCIEAIFRQNVIKNLKHVLHFIDYQLVCLFNDYIKKYRLLRGYLIIDRINLLLTSLGIVLT